MTAEDPLKATKAELCGAIVNATSDLAKTKTLRKELMQRVRSWIKAIQSETDAQSGADSLEFLATTVNSYRLGNSRSGTQFCDMILRHVLMQYSHADPKTKRQLAAVAFRLYFWKGHLSAAKTWAQKASPSRGSKVKTLSSIENSYPLFPEYAKLLADTLIFTGGHASTVGARALYLNGLINERQQGRLSNDALFYFGAAAAAKLASRSAKHMFRNCLSAATKHLKSHKIRDAQISLRLAAALASGASWTQTRSKETAEAQFVAGYACVVLKNERAISWLMAAFRQPSLRARVLALAKSLGKRNRAIGEFYRALVKQSRGGTTVTSTER